MKSVLLVTLLSYIFFLINPTPALAEEPTPTPDTQPQIQWTNDFTVEEQPSVIISLLQNFIEGFDSFMGGFIFYTPNPFGETITLKDGSEIPGVTKYRNIFYQIAIPVVAIAIAAIAMTKLGSDNAQELKTFGLRFLMVIILFITVPYVLSYSIQFNNLLVDKITDTQQFTTFLDEYLVQSEVAIQEGNPSEGYGIPSYDISMMAGVFRSLGKFVAQTFLFILTFLFLLGGFVYIGFQFVIRFASLLFLSVLYPVTLPFILSERTQNIVSSFFKLWFTFLIQQPAFVLGFAIANDIFTSILESQGPTVGMLFFYTGFLFFLGGVNMLVGRIFGDTWGNMQAAIATRTLTNPVKSGFSDFQQGLFGGNLAYATGRYTNKKFTRQTKQTTLTNKSTSNGSSGNINSNPSSGETKPGKGKNTQTPFSKVLSGKGFTVEAENPKQGIVSVTGQAYQYSDKKTGLTSIYPTRLEATQDGVPEQKLTTIELDQERFIDLSGFDKKNANPHNYNAMQESKRQGQEIDYAYIKKASPPQKVKRFLDVSQKRNNVLGINGVLIERHGRKSSSPILRMYTYKDYEKRKNI